MTVLIYCASQMTVRTQHITNNMQTETFNIIYSFQMHEVAKENLALARSSCAKITNAGCHIMVFTTWKQHDNFLCK